MTEEWRPIAGFCGYEASNLGRIGSWLPERNYAKRPTERRVLRAATDKNGYKRVVLHINGARFYKRVCILVAECWHGQASGKVVRHLDGSKDNDTPSNLCWGTAKENSKDSQLHGTWVHGEFVNTAKLTEADVRRIKASDLPHSSLARELGVSPGAVWHIRANRSWKHVS